MAHTGAPEIVVCGHLCLDIIPGFPALEGAHDWFRPGRLSLVGAPVISTGGAVSNVGLSLHRLGLPVRLVAKIGNDPLGRLIVERVRAMGENLARGLTRAEGEVTSYSVVLNPPGIDRIFLHCPGANDTFTDADVSDEVIEGASIFHFGYPPLMKQIWSDGGLRLERLLARAKAQGALTSLDMSLPDPSSPSGMIDWAALLSRVLPRVDVFVPSVEELLFMLDRPGFTRLTGAGGGEEIIRKVTFADLARLAARAHDAGVSAVLIKLGDRGAYLHTSSRGLAGAAGWASRELYTPVFSVPKIAGTVGSGDATIAGFLASVVRGLGAEEALTLAVAVGGCCVEAPDATSGIRTWEETRGRVKAGWARRSVEIREPGWRPVAHGVRAGPGDRP
ncbi:MAG: carbohydrate kinase family protein [Spirochaetia bacterium]|jgi:sugar/nucleoside kinase (ribokinase family)